MNEAEVHIDYEVTCAKRPQKWRGPQSPPGCGLNEGLPGEHHFYICFDTRADGVILSKRLREQYPDEMTVVLQHRFWDLQVDDERFEVKLTFNNIPERLVVPYRAIKVFFDPSVPYGLQFEPSQMMDAGNRSGQVATLVNREDNPASGNTDGPAAEFGDAVTPVDGPVDGFGDVRNGSTSADAFENGAEARELSLVKRSAEDDTGDSVDEEPEAPRLENTAKVVELDAFRKK